MSTRRQQQQAENVFIIPPPEGNTRDYSTNPVYQNGSALTIRWLTNITSYSIRYNQDLPNGGGSGYDFLTKLAPHDTSFQWHVNAENFDISKSRVYWFEIRDDADSDNNIAGHYFNITLPTTTSSSSSPSSTGKTTTTSSSLSSKATTIPTSSTWSTAAPSPASSSSGLSAGAAAGIGVGSAVVLVSLLVGLFLLCRRRKYLGDIVTESSRSLCEDFENEMGDNKTVSTDTGSAIGELPAHKPRMTSAFQPTIPSLIVELNSDPTQHTFELPTGPPWTRDGILQKNNMYDASPR